MVNTMNTKAIPTAVAAAVAGGLTLFLMGFIFYVLLLADFFDSSVAKDPLDFPFIVLGEVVWGGLLVWIFSRAGISTLADGAKAGAVFGFLAALAFGFIMYGATTVADFTYYLADSVVWAIRYAVAGAVVGWSLGGWASGAGKQSEPA